MKKLLLIAMVLCMSTQLFAQQNGSTVKKVFWGSKTRKSFVNPCKGVCSDVCGEIDVLFKAKNKNTTQVETVVKDKNGNVILTKTEKYSHPSHEVNSDFLVDDSKKKDNSKLPGEATEKP